MVETTAPPTRRRRAYELDLLRLVAALAVVLYHFTWRGWHGGFSPVRYPEAITRFTRYGYLGVELFFLISGMVILSSVVGRSPRQFAVSRFVRLYPVYWAMVTLTFVVERMWGSRRLYPYGVRDWLGNLTMLQSFLKPLHLDLIDGVYWTLAVELVFYGLVWAVLVLRLHDRLLTVLACWLGVSFVVEVLHVGPRDDLRLVLATRFASLFVAGACCSLLAADRRRAPAWLLLAASTGLAVHQTIGRVSEESGKQGAYALIGAGTALVCVAIVLAVSLGGLHRLGRPWMTGAGLLTYPLYLVHQRVGYILFMHLRDVARWPLLVLVIVLVTGVAWLGHRLVERPLAPRLRVLLGASPAR